MSYRRKCAVVAAVMACILAVGIVASEFGRRDIAILSYISLCPFVVWAALPMRAEEQ